MTVSTLSLFLFFFNDTSTTEIYTLSLHDALPISHAGHDRREVRLRLAPRSPIAGCTAVRLGQDCELVPLVLRSEEHTSELQSLAYLVCRLLLEKKKNTLI